LRLSIGENQRLPLAPSPSSLLPFERVPLDSISKYHFSRKESRVLIFETPESRRREIGYKVSVEPDG